MTAISVIGLGKLGACTAACFAYKGHEVIGVDVDRRTVDLINQGQAPVVEPRLQEVITAAGARLRATHSFEEAVERSEITLLLTPTPSEPGGHFSDAHLRAPLEPLARALVRVKKNYHLFVVASTVSPGTTSDRLIPLIEQRSGKKLNRDFGVCYNPAFIALGSVIHDLLQPDLVLIGESNEAAGEQLVTLYRQICENQPSVARMSIVSAEITKLSLNAYVTMKISFANTLANVCEKIPGADIDAITKALGADKRISPYYLKGGLPFGGPCFPRDNRAFAAFSREHGCEPRLADATDLVNEFQIRHLTELVANCVSSTGDRSVSILGLAYKPDTPVIEESPGMRLATELLKQGLTVAVYDPLAAPQAKAVLGDAVTYAASVRECVSRSSLWIVTTPAAEFKAIDDSFVAHNPTTVIDCWRVIDRSKFKKTIRYVALGGHPNGCPK